MPFPYNYLFLFTGSCSFGKVTTITWQYLLSGIWAPDSCHRFSFCWFICGKPLLMSPLMCQMVDMCSVLSFLSACIHYLTANLIICFSIIEQNPLNSIQICTLNGAVSLCWKIRKSKSRCFQLLLFCCCLPIWNMQSSCI